MFCCTFNYCPPRGCWDFHFFILYRLLGFYILFASVFAALTLYRIYTVWFQKCDIRIKNFSSYCIPSYSACWSLELFAPGLILHDSPRDSIIGILMIFQILPLLAFQGVGLKFMFPTNRAFLLILVHI